jgi:hypothetical protein
MSQGIAHKVDAATLPRCGQNFEDGRLDAFMRIGDDELDPAEATPGQLAQEFRLDRLGL